jgi:hypothetical protein
VVARTFLDYLLKAGENFDATQLSTPAPAKPRRRRPPA